MNDNPLAQLLEDELKDLYDAEKQLTKALPKLAKKATVAELKEAIERHLEETKRHVDRLEQAFERLGLPARGKKCRGMENLLKEGEEMVAEADDDAARDAVMIGSAQKVEHYEIAGYGTARTWAQVLGLSQVASLLQESLDEEKAADEKLTEIAESFVNPAAASADESEGAEDGGTLRKRAAPGGRMRHQAADTRRKSKSRNRR